MVDKLFCTIEDVRNLVYKCSSQVVDPLYMDKNIEMLRNKIGESNKYTLSSEGMDLATFLALVNVLKGWYSIKFADVAEFIDRKFQEKYTVTSADILGLISKALDEKETVTKHKKGRPVKKLEPEPEIDMYKAVQKALKSGMTKAAVQKKYNLTQKDLVQYEGIKYWSNSQLADHKAMLEYRRLHPQATDKECIEKGAKRDAVGYRFALVPTKEQQEAYNTKKSEKPVPKAVIKGADVKSLILSDIEQEEQQELYNKIKEIANVRNVSPREVTTSFKARLTRDYGIVIDQIKKDLMIKYRVNQGEGKAPNALEAIVMSEYLPVAKSVLDNMLEESYTVRT